MLHSIFKQEMPCFECIKPLLYPFITTDEQSPIVNICSKNQSFKKITFTCFLCLKMKQKESNKVPKVLIFKILKFVAIDKLQAFISVMNKNNQTASIFGKQVKELESNKYDQEKQNKYDRILTFLEKLESITDWNTCVEFIKDKLNTDDK